MLQAAKPLGHCWSSRCCRWVWVFGCKVTIYVILTLQEANCIPIRMEKSDWWTTHESSIWLLIEAPTDAGGLLGKLFQFLGRFGPIFVGILLLCFAVWIFNSLKPKGGGQQASGFWAIYYVRSLSHTSDVRTKADFIVCNPLMTLSQWIVWWSPTCNVIPQPYPCAPYALFADCPWQENSFVSLSSIDGVQCIRCICCRW